MTSIHRIYQILKSEGLFGIIRRFRIYRELHEQSAARGSSRPPYVPTPGELKEMSTYEFSRNIKISIVMPVYNPPPGLVEQAIQSVQNQIYPHWELCIIDDASTVAGTQERLRALAANDSRIKLTQSKENEHIASASNRGIALATGEYIAFLDQDDELAPHALYRVMRKLESTPSLDILYSNEDKIDLKGNLFGATYKPAWSREYLLSFMYLGHLAVYRASLLENLDGFQTGIDGAQDFDLALRATELTERICHIPEILYHWRAHEGSVAKNKESKDYAYRAGLRALNAFLERRSLPFAVSENPLFKGIYVLNPSTSDEDDSTHVVVYFGTVEDWSEAAPVTNSDQVCNVYRVRIGITEQSEGWISVQSFSDIFAALLKLLPRSTQSITFVNIQSGVQPLEQCRSLAAFLKLPGVGIVMPKIICNRKIEFGGASIIDSVIINHFHGAHVDSVGYGARLLSMHNLSLALPYIFSVPRTLMEEVAPQLTKGMNSYGTTLALSSIAKSTSLRVAFIPHVPFASNRCWIPAQVDLGDLGDRWDCIQDTYSINSSDDPYYPVGLDRKKRNFRVSR